MSAAVLPPYLHPLGGGVFAVDTGFHRERFDAAYLVVSDGRGAFVDTGTNLALPRLLGALDALGLPRDAVDWVIPTHVHLDHAGGAGALMRELPRARLAVHPRGVRHMADPTQLYAGALAVYGQAEMDRSYGTLVPVDPARIVATGDGTTIDFAGRPLLAIDTPGHAKHHHCLWDAATRGWFTGDTFGLAYPEFATARGPWMLPTSTPVQFDPPALRASIARLLAHDPAHIYLTHFGAVDGVPARAAQLVEMLDAMVAVGEREAARGADGLEARLREAFAALYLERAQAHGVAMPDAAVAALLELDVRLNAQGMAIWLERAARGGERRD